MVIASPAMISAQHLLDRVQSLARIDELAADPAQFTAALAAELPAATSIAELEARDAALARGLAQVDVMVARATRVALEHALADDPSIGPPTRNVFATTIVSYADELPLLAQRARDVAERGRSPDPDAPTARVVDTARAMLALRDALHAAVLALARDLATAALPDARARALDRRLEEATRRRWSAGRRDLEALIAEPRRLLAGPMAARLAALPDELDEPDRTNEPTFAEMIELE